MFSLYQQGAELMSENGEEEEASKGQAMLALVIIFITLALTFVIFQSMSEDEQHSPAKSSTSLKLEA